MRWVLLGLLVSCNPFYVCNNPCLKATSSISTPGSIICWCTQQTDGGTIGYEFPGTDSDKKCHEFQDFWDDHTDGGCRPSGGGGGNGHPNNP